MDHLSRRRGFVRGDDQERGVNCIDKMATVVIPALLGLERRWGQEKRHPDLSPWPSLINVLRIEGGGNTFVLPNDCRAYFTVVYLPGENVDAVRGHVEAEVAAAASADPWLRLHPPRVDWSPAKLAIDFRPLQGSASGAGASLLGTCVRDVTGSDPFIGGRESITDAGVLSEAGIPTVIFGPGDRDVIHGPDEYVELERVVTFAKSVALFLLRWCGEAN